MADGSETGDAGDTREPSHLVNREQIKRYRAVTTFLSWIGSEARRGTGVTQKGVGSTKYHLYSKGADLVDLLLRDDESISMTFNRAANKMTILAS